MSDRDPEWWVSYLHIAIVALAIAGGVLVGVAVTKVAVEAFIESMGPIWPIVQ